MEAFLKVIPNSVPIILVAIWIYFFIDSYRHKSGWPFGFFILFVGISVSGLKLTFYSDGVVFFSINSLFIIVLIGLLVNIADIQNQVYILDNNKTLFFSGIGLLFGLLFGFLFMVAKITDYLPGSADYTPLALVVDSIQNSVAEEFLFRGYLLSYLRKYKFNLLFAMILQSFIFTILHTRYSDNWILLAIIFLLGTIGGYLTWKSSNLIPASVMHIVVNLFAVVWRLFGNVNL